MKRNFIIGMGLFFSLNVGIAAPVEYVKICSMYGQGFFYEPGTATCLNANTGLTKTATDQGTISAESALALRVSQLEAQVQHLYQQFGIQSFENK